MCETIIKLSNFSATVLHYYVMYFALKLGRCYHLQSINTSTTLPYNSPFIYAKYYSYRAPQHAKPMVWHARPNGFMLIRRVPLCNSSQTEHNEPQRERESFFCFQLHRYRSPILYSSLGVSACLCVGKVVSLGKPLKINLHQPLFVLGAVSVRASSMSSATH